MPQYSFDKVRYEEPRDFVLGDCPEYRTETLYQVLLNGEMETLIQVDAEGVAVYTEGRKSSDIKDQPFCDDFIVWLSSELSKHAKVSRRSFLEEFHTETLKLAEKGHPPSQLMMGRMYLDGTIGGEKNPEEAKRWLKLASDSGYEEAELLMKENFA